MRPSCRRGRKSSFPLPERERLFHQVWQRHYDPSGRAGSGIETETELWRGVFFGVDPKEDTGGRSACHPQGERLPEKKRYVAHVRGNLPKRKIGGLRGLYLHYCFLLGILPKNRPPVSPKQLHFLLREDLAKLEQISRETRLLCRCHIDTDVQLFSYKESLQEQMTQLSKERQKLRYQCRSIREEDRLSK